MQIIWMKKANVFKSPNAIFHIATSANGWLIMAVNMAASSVRRRV